LSLNNNLKFMNILQNIKANINRMATSVTRNFLTRTSNIEETRKKNLELSIEDKRKLYKCGKNYVVLEDVPIWPIYKLIQGGEKIKFNFN
jgi:hypothetical protein